MSNNSAERSSLTFWSVHFGPKRLALVLPIFMYAKLKDKAKKISESLNLYDTTNEVDTYVTTFCVFSILQNTRAF